MFTHVPVLSSEVLEYLDPQPGQVAVDCTLGGGGHALAIAGRIGKGGTIVGIDLDPAAIAAAEEIFSEAKPKAKHIFVHGSYLDIDTILNQNSIARADLILADVGISSYDLEQSGRGFTFQRDEPLDMRFDPSAKKTASHIVNTYTEQRLAEVFRSYGEDKNSARIARFIVAARQKGTIGTTARLLEVITESLPKPLRFKAADSARRIFQALRIEVNGELSNLSGFLPKAFSLLAPHGRLAVISFHSLEDRTVKQFFAAKAAGGEYDTPPQGKLLTKKPVTATAEEASVNPRSKPAKLRVIEKVSSKLTTSNSNKNKNKNGTTL